MYIVIPIALILLSLGGVFFIVWRKLPYLKKLTPEVQTDSSVSLSNKEFSASLFRGLFPELVENFNSVKFNEYKDTWLVELEKILRRLRLVSLRMDRASDSLIKKIRRVYLKNEIQDMAPPAIQDVATLVTPPVVKIEEVTAEDLKREEQKLIIEIAKSPKNSKLYDVLGDLYMKMRIPSDAKESFEAAIELDPNNEDLKRKLSRVLEKMNPQNTKN